MQVFKFGGTSMGSPERIRHVAEICSELKPTCVVVSAMAGETNRLVALGKEISSETNVPEYDLLVASGEQVSVALLSMALRKRGIKPYPMLASHAGILSSELHSKAQILRVDKEFILSKVTEGYLPVIAGFQGITQEGLFTSLGRGGSDTSAVAIAAGIGAETCVIYTDVDGVYTTDPRLCPRAKLISRIQFEEMLEMASQGSKVLHIRSVQVAAKWGVKLIVRNTFSQSEGTEMVISENPIEGEIVTGISASIEEALINLGNLTNETNTLFDVFGLLAKHGINVDIIGQNLNSANVDGNLKVGIHFTVAESDLAQTVKVLGENFKATEISSRTDVAKISIVGVGMRSHPGVAASMFKTLAELKIPVIIVTTSEIKVACLIPRSETKRAVDALHRHFFETV